MDVNVRIKDEKHAKKVIKRLIRIGYKEYDDGDYQLLNYNENIEIKPKDLMDSDPVKYFLEHRHV